MFVLTLYLQKNIDLSLSKIDTLNFTMYSLTILTCPLKTYVIRLYNLTSMHIFFTIKYRSSFLQPKTKNLFETQTSLHRISMNIFTIKDDTFPSF